MTMTSDLNREISVENEKRNRLVRRESSTTDSWMDFERHEIIAYEYLCHLEETKKWIEVCIEEELPPSVELENELRNGVILAKLANFFAKEFMEKKKIYDTDTEVYRTKGLKFRHTDNINYWFQSMAEVGLPNVFVPETNDLYDKKNMPKVIYCIHALSHYLYKRNMGPKIQDLVGTAKFTDEEIGAVHCALTDYGVAMPQFGKIGGVLAKELKGNDAEKHAAIIAINQAVLEQVDENTLAALKAPAAGIMYIFDKEINHYQECLFNAIRDKEENAEKDHQEEKDDDVYRHFLTQEEIQNILLECNVKSAMEKLNISVREADDYLGTYKIMLTPCLELESLLNEKHAETYQIKLKEKQDSLENNTLSLDYVKSVINDVNVSLALKELNESVSEEIVEKTFTSLHAKELGVTDLLNIEYAEHYQNELRETQKVLPNQTLGLDDIYACINEVNTSQKKQEYYRNNEDAIRKLQALWRSKMAQNELDRLREEKKTFYNDNADKIALLQAHMKAMRQRRLYEKMRQEHRDRQAAALKIQTWWRGISARKEFLQRKEMFKKNESNIRRVQTWLRNKQAKKRFDDIINSEEPSTESLQKFINLLNRSDVDIADELELQTLHQQVVNGIRENQHMEDQVTQMDLRIGLLLKNRISIDEVIRYQRKRKRQLKKKKTKPITGASTATTVLSRDNRDRLASYQNMFYLLQTRPGYLAKLLYLPQIGTNKFLQFLVLTLYNFAQTEREEYLLLKVIKAAVDEEFELIESPKDFLTGHPLVLKLVVEYNRGVNHQSYLRELLQPLLLDVLKTDYLNMSTQVQESCKRWASKKETETGQPMDLPVELSVDQALDIEEFRSAFTTESRRLIDICDMFLKAIIASIENLPYGIRHISAYLSSQLKKKFPDCSDDEKLKIVGHLVFFKYISPAIVAPDAFHLLDNPNESENMEKIEISPEQRRMLGQISKMLQLVASHTLLPDFEQPVLKEINAYISNAHIQFKEAFDTVSHVPEAEEYFNVDKYSDLTLTTKPTISITGESMNITHRILWDAKNMVCPDAEDPLRMTLETLGEPTEAQKQEDDDDDGNELGHDDYGDTENILLSLCPKLDAAGEEQQRNKALFIRTKGLVVAIIRCQVGKNLVDILNTPANPAQVELHEKHISFLMELQRKSDDSQKDSLWAQMVQESMGSLQDIKRIVLNNLATLEEAHLVSSENNYQEILNAVAKDIRNQSTQRKQRKREINRLKSTKRLLDRKARYFEEQQSVYETYIKQILDQMGTGTSTYKAKEVAEKKSTRFGSKKFSAKKLHKMGVLLEIVDVSPALYSGISFDISSPEIGVFDVVVTAGASKQGETRILLDELLQMQVDGVARHQIEDLKINVNLLIHLLNTTFYTSSKKSSKPKHSKSMKRKPTASSS